MAKVMGLGYNRPEVLDALRALGVDPNMVRRFVVDVSTGSFPVLHIEMVGDPRIIDLALTLAQVSELRVEHCGPRPAALRIQGVSDGAPGT